jgi:hypothetical protein
MARSGQMLGALYWRCRSQTVYLTVLLTIEDSWMINFNVAVNTCAGIKKIPVTQFNVAGKVVLHLKTAGLTSDDDFIGFFVCFDKDLNVTELEKAKAEIEHNCYVQPLIFVDINMRDYGNKLIYQAGCTGFSVGRPAVNSYPALEWDDDSLDGYLLPEELGILTDFLKTLYSLKYTKELQPLASSLEWSKQAQMVILGL